MADYEILRQRHLLRYLELLPEYVLHLAWPRERVEQEQTDRLRKMLCIAREKSASHRDRLRTIDIDSITRDNMRLLPVMTKDDLMSNWDAIATDPRLTLDVVDRHLQTIASGDAYLLDEFHAVASGGSSGRRGVFAWSWDAWACASTGSTRWSVWHVMRNPGAGTRPPVVALVAASAATHMSSALAQTFATPFPPVHRYPVTMPMKEIVAALNEVQPTQLRGYASALHELARETLVGNLRITPTSVAPDGEPLLPEMRETMERAWDAPVGGLYGTSEACVTASSCFGGDGMHISDDMVILEPIDGRGQPVPAGELSSSIYLTNLYNDALPLIRYEISDQVRVLSDPCPCGSSFARVDDIHGRLDHVFTYRNGVVIHPHVFRSPLSRDPEIVEYQVRQTARGADIAIRAAGDVDVQALRGTISEHVAQAGLESPEIKITRVEAIERTSAGKLTRFVPLPR